MKKFLALVLAAIMLMSLFACDKKTDNNDSKNDGKICDIDIMDALTLDKLYKGKLSEEEIAAIPAEKKAWMDERCAVLKARTEEYYRLANLIR